MIYGSWFHNDAGRGITIYAVGANFLFVTHPQGGILLFAWQPKKSTLVSWLCSLTENSGQKKWL